MSPDQGERASFDLLGLIYKDWRPTPEEGVTVFLQGLDKRGDNNLRKRIYFSGVTPDLYVPKYQKKVVAFFDQLLDPKFAGKPFMRHYLDHYFDVYWDLHLGVKGDAIPAGVRQIGESFNTVLAYRNPTRQIVFENYMKVRELLDPLKEWIDERLKDLENGRTPDPDKTIAWYWLKNAGNGEHFAHKDIVFECFHNFVALSQWGNSIFGIMSRLTKHGGDAEVQASFVKTMSGDYDHTNGGPFTPLQLFVMELFRTISPNGGSLSAIEDAPRSFYGQSPHTLLDARFRALRLYEHAAYLYQLRPRTLDQPAAVRSRSLQDRPDQRPDRRSQMQADRPCPVPVRHHEFQRRRRPQGEPHQQRLRHSLRGR